MGQKRQGGSTIGYVLIGIVLVGVLIGGIYALRQLMTTKPAEVSTQSQKTREETDKNKQQESGDSQNSEQSSQDASQTEKKSQESTSTQSNSSSSEVVSAELPKTGPSSLTGIFAVGILAMAGTAYVRSRRFTL